MVYPMPGLKYIRSSFLGLALSREQGDLKGMIHILSEGFRMIHGVNIIDFVVNVNPLPFLFLRSKRAWKALPGWVHYLAVSTKHRQK